MLAQRAMQQSLRRAVTAQHPILKATSPAAIVTASLFRAQRRHVAATTVSQETEHTNILAQQRLNRPVSPHLSIYKPQITWYGSITHRITGCILSGAFYLYGTAYLIAPHVGWHLESATLATSFAAWPWALKFATKMFFAVPFVYHSVNGVRHLIWDTASMIQNQKVIQSGWIAVGLTAIGSVALSLL